MDTFCNGNFDVLGPAEYVGAEGTGGIEDAGTVGNGVVTTGGMDGTI